MAKHKADGLFYVTADMLQRNFACRAAVMVTAVKAGHLYDRNKVLVTAELIQGTMHATSGVISWMIKRVPDFADCLAVNKDIDALRQPIQRVMDALWLLAIKRGLVKEES